MTTLGAILLAIAAFLTVLWILDLVRRGKLYVGYGIVFLFLVSSIVIVSILPPVRDLAERALRVFFPFEPIAIIGLAATVLLLVYVLHQLSVLSDRVAYLTQEIAIRDRTETVREEREGGK